MSVSQHRRKDAPTARQRWSTLAVTALGLLLAQPAAYAAGFGQLRVQSNLGQPLQAEIDISGVSAEEAAGLNVKLASPAAYAAAGLTYLPAVSSLRLEVERRPNGSYVARVRSSQPISEPFVDILVDMSWASGKVSRAYTFLLDPAGAKPSNQTFSPATVMQAATPDAPPVAAPAPAAAPQPAPAQVAAPAAAAEAVKPAAPARPARQSAKRAPAQAASGSTEMAPGGGYTVQRGDTLYAIAGEAVQGQESVSLDQMLVALYRNNPNAFIGGNMNRLRSGAVLQVPTQQQAQAVAPKAARREVVARTQGFNAYRSRLASAAAAKSVEPDSGRQQSGNVTARVQEQAAPTDGPRDELKLSKAARGAQADAAAKAEAGVARERELKEAQARLAQLEKNVGDMQKLLELKNAEIAKLSQANQTVLAEKEKAEAAAKAAAAAPTVVAAQPPKADAVAPAPVAAAATAAATAATAASAPAAAGASAADAVAPAAASAVAAVPASQPAAAIPASAAQAAAAASAPAAKRPPVLAAQPEPVPQPSFIDGLLANPMLLPGGGLLVALLGVYAIYRRRQQQKAGEATGFGDSILSQESTVMAGANSLFGTAGGQSVDTSQHSVFGADFRIGNNTPEANEVDPIAEAEVYIAYGRDVQAEEILREALEKNPEQQPVRLKLLEIYSNRQDVEGFRVIAEEMFAQTGGHGAEWLKAAEMGRALEPGNALFLAVTPEAAGPDTTSPATDQWRTQDPSQNPASIARLEPSLGDLALPLDAFPAPAAGEPIVAPASAAMVFGADAHDAGEPVRLDLGLPGTGADPLADDVPTLDTPTRSRPLEFDMSGLSLDLGSAAQADARGKDVLDEATMPLPATTMLRDGKLAEPIDLSRVAPETGGDLTHGGSPSTLSVDGVDGGRDMQIKLDLARAYIEIGDKEGARELLQEVVEQSQDPLQAEARSLLQEVA
ncbi:Tfp pilus assembly protein FimV [Cupriavidus necator N-1]|uniref:Tfp pilus assembly protein FimV n=1 Tax=Cupriavidus necator (strain ATCC 43291 / DSM 13513 / CCUG 52238 / LMG 8453 / N-1) TaxID=1042878 RepID=G0ERD5_CUPNN|nr:FimV/HubP family polar landmark protein [Cupriavidus necator]AEI77817.1 Tfp pilus assembly protein FimV [Cupriavidus necator N-1]KAI3606539.1 putative transmembrane protein [Cupriavidus necator H850]MDX6013648.1 FimV/HubP family polar landmark protein [Cupriavidus necator]